MEETIIDSASQAITTPITPEIEATLSVLDLATKGGWIMLVLLGLSLIAVYVFVVKLLQLRAAAQQDRHFMARIKDYISEGKTATAIKLCEETDTPASRMVHKGLTRLGRPMGDILVMIENVGNIEMGKLEKGLPVLATISAGAPMIGFLGTVTGMVRAFFDMANTGGAGVDVTLLSGGIYEALVTTVGGLVVGIATLFAYNYLVAQLAKVTNILETKTVEFMDLLNESL